MKIEKGVPVPSAAGMYPFADMGIGDSVRVPRELLKRVRSASDNYARRHGWKFVCRKISQDEWRLWRTA